jgi:hypothetical protein
MLFMKSVFITSELDASTRVQVSGSLQGAYAKA